MTAMESSTTILRRMLDERGVEWEGTPGVTFWGDCSALDMATNEKEKVHLHLCCTPEQAIAATLGNGECENVSYRVDESRFHCSECGFGCWVKNVATGRDELPAHCPNCGRKVKR